MRIVFASYEYPPTHFGGSALSVKLLAEGMARRGHVVTVVTPRWNENDVPCEQKWIKVGMAGAEFAIRFKLERYPRTRGMGWWSCYRMLCLVGRDADVLHAQDRRMFWPTWLAAKRLRKPMALTLRDVGLLCPVAVCLLTHKEIPRDCSARKLWRECAPDYLARYHQRTVGARLGWRWRRDLAIRSRLVLVAKYLGLRLTRWVSLRHVVGFVSHGLMTVYEQTGFLPRRATVPSIAWANVGVAQSVEHGPVEPAHIGSNPTPHPTVYFFGKHSDGKGWQDYRAAMGWTGVLVRFYAIEGATQDAAWRIMATAFAVVVPSRNCDALPRVALEAAYLGVPVIGSDRGGLPEITPAIVPAGDPAALAAEIRRMVESPAYRQTVAEECQRRARTRFSEATCCGAVERMYAHQ